MNSTEYTQYLHSQAWREKSRKRMELDDYKCTMCGCVGTANNPLTVHHLGYKNLGQENVYKDLLTLCKSCHRATHRMMSRITGFYPDGRPRRGWAESTRDFSGHVFTVTGETGDNWAVYGDD